VGIRLHNAKPTECHLATLSQQGDVIMTSKEQAQVSGTLQKLFMLCLKYPTAENLALAKETMEAINMASIQTKEKAEVSA
jgi:hypothetical protein